MNSPDFGNPLRFIRWETALALRSHPPRRPLLQQGGRCRSDTVPATIAMLSRVDLTQSIKASANEHRLLIPANRGVALRSTARDRISSLAARPLSRRRGQP